MCDFSGRLIAWMDRELLERERAEIQRHLAACPECREQLAAYEKASRAFDAYCEAVFTEETRHKAVRWRSVAGFAAGIAAAAAIAVLMTLPTTRTAPVQGVTPPEAMEHAAARTTEPPRVPTQRDVAVEAARTPAIQVKRAPRRYIATPVRIRTEKAVARQVQTQTLTSFPMEPSIEIAIPGDAVFPPGAVPPGMSFTADLTISADGLPEKLGLRPRFAAFERRTNQP